MLRGAQGREVRLLMAGQVTRGPLFRQETVQLEGVDATVEGWRGS